MRARADGRGRLAHGLRRATGLWRSPPPTRPTGGADLAGAAAAARRRCARTADPVVVDTLEYLRRGGRIGAAQAWIGAALKVKPILSIEGEMQPVERVRTAGRAFERLVAQLEQRQRATAATCSRSSTSRRPTMAERLAERGREIYGRDPELVSEIGPVIGTHTGPGILGVAGLRSALLGPVVGGIRAARAGTTAAVGVPLDPPQSRHEPPLVRVVPELSPRIIVRTLFITVVFASALYLIYLLRRPIGWMLIAASWRSRCRARSTCSTATCSAASRSRSSTSALLLIPILIGALIVPPLVTQGNNLVQDLPDYAQDAQEFAQKNERLRQLEEDYNITEKLQEQAEKLPARIGDAASVLGDIGLGVVNSLFALFTILVLTRVPARQRARLARRVLELRPAASTRARCARRSTTSGKAVGDYVGGALAQATVAGVLAYIVLIDPRRAVRRRARDRHLLLRPRAAGRRDDRRDDRRHRHACSATSRRRRSCGSIYSIVYQQVENTVIQPQIQARRSTCTRSSCSSPCCSAPRCSACSARWSRSRSPPSMQIAIREWCDYRHDQRAADRRADGAGAAAGSRRPPEPSSTPRAAAAGQQAGHRGDPAAEHEARDGGADDHLALVGAQLRAPVGRLGDLAAQLLDRDAELGAVGLDRAPDLLRGAARSSAPRPSRARPVRPRSTAWPGAAR